MQGSCYRAMSRGRGIKSGRGRGMSMGSFLTYERGISKGSWYCLALLSLSFIEFEWDLVRYYYYAFSASVTSKDIQQSTL